MTDPKLKAFEDALDEIVHNCIARQKNGACSRCDPKRSEVIRLYEEAVKDGERLRRDLKLAAVRLGILADRMQGCNDASEESGEKPRHELLDEARSFAQEAASATEQEGENG